MKCILLNKSHVYDDCILFLCCKSFAKPILRVYIDVSKLVVSIFLAFVDAFLQDVSACE